MSLLAFRKSRTQTRLRNTTRYVTWYLFLVMKVARIEMSEINTKHQCTKGLILVWHIQATLPWPIHYLKSRHTSYHVPQRIHLYQPALVKSCSLVKIQILYPATLSLRFSHPDSLKTQIPAPASNWNSRLPLLFSAPIPNIATKISQIPHPAKPIVDPPNWVLTKLRFLRKMLNMFYEQQERSL